MKNLRFNTRIFIGFGTIILTIVVIIYISLTQIKKISKNTDMLYNHPFTVSNAVRDINFNIIIIYRTTKWAVKAENKVEYDLAVDSLKKCENIIRESFKIINERFLGDKNLVDDAQKGYVEWRTICDSVLALKQAGKDIEAFELRETRLSEYDSLIFSRANKLSIFAKRKAIEFYSESKISESNSYNIILVVFILLLLISFLTAIIISSSISRQIKSFIKDIKILFYKTDTDHEVADLSEVQLFDKTVFELKSAYEEIQKYSEELKTSNEELASINEEFASANEEIKTMNEELEIRIEQRTKELKQSEYFFRESQKAAKIGSYMTNFVTGFWESSEILDEIFGIDKNYVRSVSGWLNIIHEDEKEHLNTYLLEDVIDKKQSFNKEYRIRRINDKQERWVYGLGAVEFDEKGNILSMIGTIQDITDRKIAEDNVIKSEQKTRMILENINDALIIDDTEGRVVFANEQFFKLFGFKPEDLSNISLESYIAPEWKQLLKDRHNRRVRGENVESTFEYQGIQTDGTLIWIEVNVVAVNDNSGKIIGTQSALRNITERKIAEKEILLAKEKAEESDRLKSAFLANLSHEVRTPMNAIVGFSEILASRNIDFEKQKHFLNLIGSSTNQLLNIITDIVNMSKLEVNLEKTFLSTFNLNSIMEKTLSVMQIDKEKKENVSLIYENESKPTKLYISSDEVKLEQILINIIKNALKFTDSGQVKFGYKVKNKEIEFFVSDTGCGIEQGKQQIVFERFRQADDSIAVMYGGNGLGLAISKGYTELLGGKIWLDSTVGVGTTFYFTIPYIPIENIQTIELLEIDLKKLHNKTILIAEDSSVNIEYLKSILNQYSVKIKVAINGQEAINLCNSELIDIVLMDIQMPEINGLDATKIIKQSYPTLPVIGVSAYCSSIDIQNCIDSGCSGFVSKPYNQEDILNEIAKHLS